MSVQAITWALDYAAGSVTEKVILLVLANYANEYGISWPSQKTLADQTALGERTVRRVLADMDIRGVIRRIPRRRSNGSRQSDMILLTAFEGRKPAPPGMLDDDGETDNLGAFKQPANGDKRPVRPPDNRPLWPHPPATVAALDTSLILKNSTQLTNDDWQAACLAVAGDRLDRGRGSPLRRSVFEITRWIEAGCSLLADVLPVIESRTADPSQNPIRTWGYFTAAILEAKARREKPLPKPKEIADEHASPHRKANHHKSTARDSSNAWNAAVEKADRARAAQTDPNA
jgi:hypothetical protein